MIAQMAARLNAQRTLERALDTVLADSISFVGASKGVIRLVDETGGLVIVAVVAIVGVVIVAIVIKRPMASREGP